MRYVWPIAMPRDQFLDVIVEIHPNLTLSIRVEETMPPRVDYTHLEQPTRREELLKRKADWATLQERSQR